MMPVAGIAALPEVQTLDYKKKYKALKRKLKFLVYEHESFLEELKKAQRKLLKVSRDRSFLLDLILQHEKVDESSSDSEATASSDTDVETVKDGGSTKKRKSAGTTPVSSHPVLGSDQPPVLGSATFGNSLPLQSPQASTGAQSGTMAAPEPAKKKPKIAKKAHKSGSNTGRPTVAQALQHQQQLQQQKLQEQHKRQQQPQQQRQHSVHVSLAEAIAPGHMTREELERHLEYKQSTKPQFMSIDKAPNMLPDDIFNDDNSFSDSDIGERPMKEEEDLIIDTPSDI